MSVTTSHHHLVPLGVAGHGELLGSAGVRGFPGPAAGLCELLDAVAAEDRTLLGAVADATGSAGGGALAAPAATRVMVLEPSFAAARAAQARFEDEERIDVVAGLPWDLDRGGWPTVLLLPPTDRGNDRVRVELAAAARALAPGGVAYAAMHKDRGAKRYERDAAAWFDGVSVVRRSRGWRVVRLEGGREPGAELEAEAREGGRPGAGAASGGAPASDPWRSFEALGRCWWSLPGVHAARALDPGTSLLLAALDAGVGRALDGAAVADLGCGTGILADAALRAGAEQVTALDDDLGAVRSARRNLPDRASVLHSDLDAALAPDVRFDAFLVNPPFHLGKQVRLELARAFLGTARERLRAGGSAWIVANRALPYERELDAWKGFETVRLDAGFKVLRAWV